MHLGVPVGALLFDASFTFALEEAVAAFDEAVVGEDGDGGVGFEDDGEGVASALEVGGEGVVDGFVFELVGDVSGLGVAFGGEAWVAPAGEDLSGVVGGFGVAEDEEFTLHGVGLRAGSRFQSYRCGSAFYFKVAFGGFWVWVRRGSGVVGGMTGIFGVL